MVDDEGGILGPGQYMVVTFPTQFIDNEQESLMLLDGQGNEIDHTSSLDDKSNDQNTQQRVPDGGSTWTFRSGTQGATNSA